MPDDGDFTYSPMLLDWCEQIWVTSGSALPPDPRKVELYDMDYLDQIIRWTQGVKFYYDYPHRPKGMQ